MVVLRKGGVVEEVERERRVEGEWKDGQRGGGERKGGRKKG